MAPSSADLFFGTSGLRDAKIAIIGEAWGYEESIAHRPFVGQSGQELDRMLAEAGIRRDEVFCSNIVSERPPHNDFFQFLTPNQVAKESKIGTERGLFLTDKVRQGLDLLRAQLNAVRPELIILAGNYPLWAFTDVYDVNNVKPPERNPHGYTWKVPGGIAKQRGSMLFSREGFLDYRARVLPIYHPAGILRNWATRAVTVHDLKVRVPLALSNKWERPPWQYTLGTTLDTVIQSLDNLLTLVQDRPVDMSIDLETRNRCIASIALTADGQSALAIPFMRPTESGIQSWWQVAEEVEIVRRLRTILQSPNCRRIGQNFAYDSQYMSFWWKVKPRVDFDTMVGQHLLFPGTPKALYYLASIYCGDYYAFWKEDSQEWEEKLDIERLLAYNCEDVIYTWHVAQTLRDAILRAGRSEHYQFLLDQWDLAQELMDRGVLIDKNKRAEMSIEVMAAAEERVEFLKRVVPEWTLPPVGRTAKPWYRSPIQQQRFFYDCLGCKSASHRKTGNVTINNEALSELKIRYPELTQIITAIQELRSLGVFQNNFLSAAIDPDGRMRSSFNLMPETYRWSSSENAFRRGTNFQNIPKGNE